MSLTRDFLVFLAMMMVHQCTADGPPPPTDLSYEWLDPFTVNVSWQKPRGLLDGEVRYKYIMETTAGTPVSRAYPTYTIWRNFNVSCLTEDTRSDKWKFTVETVASQSNGLKLSRPASITVHAPKPRAEVKDTKCLIDSKGMNCSWIPGNQPFNFSYRICGRSEQRLKALKTCEKPHRGAVRNSCYLKANPADDICMLVDTGSARSTFIPVLVMRPPKLSIGEEGFDLVLSWTPPEIITKCLWTYEVCYKKCNGPKIFLNVTSNREKIPYDRRCRYEVQVKVRKPANCKEIFSEFSDVVTYGTNDETLLVVAIVIPIILSACIILSCYCFRRHSSIIFPTIPDPSAIFKEMMRNGNIEHTAPTGSLYTPVPEPIEPCKITRVAENSVLQENS